MRSRYVGYTKGACGPIFKTIHTYAELFYVWITMSMVSRRHKSSKKCSPQRVMRCLNASRHRERIGMSICCNEMCSGKGGDNFQKKK